MISTLHVNRTPTGLWAFVGRVPVALGYMMKDGSPVTDQIARGIAHCGPGLYRDRIQPRTWLTADLARAAALELGYVAEDN